MYTDTEDIYIDSQRMIQLLTAVIHHVRPFAMISRRGIYGTRVCVCVCGGGGAQRVYNF